MPLKFESLEDRKLMSVTASLVPVTISSAAIAADSKLANYKTYDLVMTVGSGDDWISNDLRVDLKTGSFYVPASGNSNTAQPGAWSGSPNLQFDTFVASPNNGTPVLLGSYDPASNSAQFSSNVINVTFGDIPNTGPGTFTAARLTMTNDANATIRGRTGNRLDPSNPVSFNFNVAASGKLRGKVFRDRNGDGAQTGSEPTLTGVRIYIDANNDGTFQSKELSTVSTSTGTWTLTVPANVTYRVRSVVPANYRVTTPSGNQWLIAAPGAGSTVRNFGLTSSVILSGTIFRDQNNNKVKDSTEGGLAGWRAYIDTNNNGVWDSSSEQSTQADGSGKYTFLSVPENTNLTVRIVVSSGWKLTTQSSFVVRGAAGTEVTKKNFGVRKLT